MPASEARILANQANAKLSKDPKSPEGKECSRQNSYKHGMTGNGVVMSIEDAAEVDRRSAVFQDELQPSGEVGEVLVRRAAFMSVQLDRSMVRQNDDLAERLRRVELDFVAPEGVDAAEAGRLKDIAKRQATFDPSPEAALARKYEAAAERGFLRALKELRLLEKPARAASPMVNDKELQRELASFLPKQKPVAKIEARRPEPASMPLSEPSNRFEPLDFSTDRDVFDVPIAIGRRR